MPVRRGAAVTGALPRIGCRTVDLMGRVLDSVRVLVASCRLRRTAIGCSRLIVRACSLVPSDRCRTPLRLLFAACRSMDGVWLVPGAVRRPLCLAILVTAWEELEPLTTRPPRSKVLAIEGERAVRTVLRA